MRVLPVKVSFEINEAAYPFRIELKHKSLIVYHGESVTDLAIAYNPRIPVSSHDNSNSLYCALHYILDLLSSNYVQALTETNKKTIINYLHRRVIKVSNNYFKIPLGANNSFNTRTVEATTVSHV